MPLIDDRTFRKAINNIAEWGDTDVFPPSWRMISEHLLPYASGIQLWQGLLLDIPARGGPEDNGQTAIMIYKGAADRKTLTDNEVTRQWKDELATVKLRQTMDVTADMFGATQTPTTSDEALMQRAGGAPQAIHSDALLEAGERILDDVMRRLRGISDSAVTNTIKAVQDEWNENGGKRAESKAIPGAEEIRAAAGQQFQDLRRIGEQAVHAAAEAM